MRNLQEQQKGENPWSTWRFVQRIWTTHIYFVKEFFYWAGSLRQRRDGPWCNESNLTLMSLVGTSARWLNLLKPHSKGEYSCPFSYHHSSTSSTPTVHTASWIFPNQIRKFSKYRLHCDFQPLLIYYYHRHHHQIVKKGTRIYSLKMQNYEQEKNNQKYREKQRS